jgi:hypothetical protein
VPMLLGQCHGVVHFLRRPPERIAKDQDRPLFGRQLLDGCQVGKLDGFSRYD